MKKSIIIGALFLLSVLAISFAAAQVLPAPTELPGAFSDFLNNGKSAGFFKDLLLGYDVAGAEMITRFLLVLLLTTVLFQPAYNVLGKKSGIAFIVAFLVSILGIRFLSITNLNAVMLPYGALAIAASTIIPFLLFLYLLEMGDLGKNHPVIRKIGWAIIAASFLFLWTTRYKEVGEISYLYGLMALLSVGLLLFDGTIQRAIMMSKMKSAHARSGWRSISELEADIMDDKKALAIMIANNPRDPKIKTAKNEILKKEKALQMLYKNFNP